MEVDFGTSDVDPLPVDNFWLKEGTGGLPHHATDDLYNTILKKYP